MKFKLLLILPTILGVGALSNTAMSADMAAPASYDWTGIYVGAQVGADMLAPNVSGPVGGRVANANVLAGGLNLQALMQSDHFVFGAVVDGNLTTGAWGIGPCGNPNDNCNSTTANNFSLRGKLGFASDRLMFYGTAGWGWADYQKEAVIAASGVVLDHPQYGLSGWVAGAGLAYAVSPNWSVGAEFLHYDLGSGNPFVETGPQIVAPTVNTINVSLNYKF